MDTTWRRRLVHRTINETLQVSQGIHPQDKSGENIRHSNFSPKKFNMPQMSYVDTTFNAAHDLIYALYNTAPEISLVKLENGHKD